MVLTATSVYAVRVCVCVCACVYPEYICSEVCTARCQWSGGVRPIYGAPPGWAGLPISGVSVCLCLWQTSMQRCWLKVVVELSLWLLLFSYQVCSSRQLWLQCTPDQGSTCTKWVELSTLSTAVSLMWTKMGAASLLQSVWVNCLFLHAF